MKNLNTIKVDTAKTVDEGLKNIISGVIFEDGCAKIGQIDFELNQETFNHLVEASEDVKEIKLNSVSMIELTRVMEGFTIGDGILGERGYVFAKAKIQVESELNVRLSSHVNDLVTFRKTLNHSSSSELKEILWLLIDDDSSGGGYMWKCPAMIFVAALTSVLVYLRDHQFIQLTLEGFDHYVELSFLEELVFEHNGKYGEGFADVASKLQDYLLSLTQYDTAIAARKNQAKITQDNHGFIAMQLTRAIRALIAEQNELLETLEENLERPQIKILDAKTKITDQPIEISVFVDREINGIELLFNVFVEKDWAIDNHDFFNCELTKKEIIQQNTIGLLTLPAKA